MLVDAVHFRHYRRQRNCGFGVILQPEGEADTGTHDILYIAVPFGLDT